VVREVLVDPEVQLVHNYQVLLVLSTNGHSLLRVLAVQVDQIHQELQLNQQDP
jgi:hypothetical protein